MGDFVHTLGDAHLYPNHLDQARLQLTREPRPLPTLRLDPAITDIDDFALEHISDRGLRPAPGHQGPDRGLSGDARQPVARPEVIGIAAVARNGVIGAGNDIPWRIPEDWARFKAITMGHVLIMGRKTYDSIGRPLPGRTTVVVTRDPAWHVDGVIVAADLDEAFARAHALSPTKVFVAGGGQIYAAAWDRLDRLEITEVDAEPAGDVRFPVDRPGVAETDRESRDGFAFITFRRNSEIVAVHCGVRAAVTRGSRP